jgi:AraC family transcriptional regulator
MSRKPISKVDFRQEGSKKHLITNPAQLSSRNLGWQDLHFELHQQPSQEMSENFAVQHIISCSLCTTPSERWLNGKFQHEFQRIGDTVIIPANVLHRSQWDREVRFMAVAVEPTLLQRVGQKYMNSDRIELIPHFATVRDPLIFGILSSLRETVESGDVSNTLYIDQLKTTFAMHLLRKYCTTTPNIADYCSGLSPSKLKKAIEYIQAHLNEEIKLMDIADRLGMSQYYFARLFKQSMHISPYQYVIQQRIDRAKHLLKTTSISMSEIAYQTGFSHQSQLTNQFRKIVGTTPINYRKQR